MLIDEPRESRDLVELYAERLRLRKTRREGAGSRLRPRRTAIPVIREFGRQSSARSHQPLDSSSSPSGPPPTSAGDDYTSAPA